jgi:hypothetical protein
MPWKIIVCYFYFFWLLQITKVTEYVYSLLFCPSRKWKWEFSMISFYLCGGFIIYVSLYYFSC